MSFIYRDYRFLNYSHLKHDYCPLQSIKPNQSLNQAKGFPFNSKTLRSELYADYDIPGPGSYDSTSHSIEAKMINYQLKHHPSKERPKLKQIDINDKCPSPGPCDYQLPSRERRSRMKKQERIKLINSKRFSNIFSQNHKILKVDRPNQLSLLLTGDNSKSKDKNNHKDKATEKLKSELVSQVYIEPQKSHTYVDDIKEQLSQSYRQLRTNSEFALDNSNTKENMHRKNSSQQTAEECNMKEEAKEKLTALMLCHQLFKVKRFLNSSMMNEKMQTNLLMKKGNEAKVLSRVGPGSYNTKSQFDLKKHPVLFQNFYSSNARRFEFLPNTGNFYRENSNSTPGPGAYFKARQMVSINKQISHTGKPQVAKLKRLFDRTNYPGPGTYNLVKPSLKQKSDSLNSCFSSSQKRFSEYSNVFEESPGPADYFKADTPQYNKPLKPVLTKLSMPLRRVHNKSITPTPCRNDTFGKCDSLYHSIYSNTRMKNQSIAPFGSNLPQQMHNAKAHSSLGPGKYFKDLSLPVNKRHSPQCIISETKPGELFPINTLTKDLSQYTKDSYFNWHKKSFNLSLV